MQVMELGTLDPYSPEGRQWEALAAGCENAGVMQSLHWANFKRKLGLRTLHLALYDGDSIIGGAIFSFIQQPTIEEPGF